MASAAICWNFHSVLTLKRIQTAGGENKGSPRSAKSHLSRTRSKTSGFLLKHIWRENLHLLTATTIRWQQNANIKKLTEKKRRPPPISSLFLCEKERRRSRFFASVILFWKFFQLRGAFMAACKGWGFLASGPGYHKGKLSIFLVLFNICLGKQLYMPALE